MVSIEGVSVQLLLLVNPDIRDNYTIIFISLPAGWFILGKTMPEVARGLVYGLRL